MPAWLIVLIIVICVVIVALIITGVYTGNFASYRNINMNKFLLNQLAPTDEKIQKELIHIDVAVRSKVSGVNTGDDKRNNDYAYDNDQYNKPYRHGYTPCLLACLKKLEIEIKTLFYQLISRKENKNENRPAIAIWQ